MPLPFKNPHQPLAVNIPHSGFYPQHKMQHFRNICDV